MKISSIKDAPMSYIVRQAEVYLEDLTKFFNNFLKKNAYGPPDI